MILDNLRIRFMADNIRVKDIYVMQDMLGEPYVMVHGWFNNTELVAKHMLNGFTEQSIYDNLKEQLNGNN